MQCCWMDKVNGNTTSRWPSWSARVVGNWSRRRPNAALLEVVAPNVSITGRRDSIQVMTGHRTRRIPWGRRYIPVLPYWPADTSEDLQHGPVGDALRAAAAAEAWEWPPGQAPDGSPRLSGP